MPKWKYDLYNLYGFDISNINNNNNNNAKIECVNSLRINSTMEEFGIGNIIDTNTTDTTHYRVLIQFYKDFIDQLLTIECSSLEIMIKYTVEYRQIQEDFSTLNLDSNDVYYEKVYSAFMTYFMTFSFYLVL
jgi:hypothetical protein